MTPWNFPGALRTPCPAWSCAVQLTNQQEALCVPLVHTKHKASAHPKEKATDIDSPSSRRQADVRSTHY